MSEGFLLKLNTPDEYGNVPLHTAVIRDDVELLEELLSHSHLDVDYKNYKGETPLILSLRMFRSISFITKLIRAGCDINATNKFGQTCLHVALLCSSTDTLRMLIENGADVNVQDDEKRTPLHYAVDDDNYEAVCMLLCYGIDVSVLCKDNMSAFNLALYRNRTDIAQVLFPYYDQFFDADLDGYNALHLAAWHKNELAFDLVNAGIDVNFLTFDGSSPLILSLDYETDDLFKLIWSKLDCSTLLHQKQPFLLTYMENLPFSSREWVDSMYMVLESPLAFELIDHCRNYFSYEAFEYGFFSKLLKSFYFFGVDVKDRVAIIYICLSLGCSVNISDVNFASVLFGYNEELEIFLRCGDFQPRPFDFDHCFNLVPHLAFVFAVKDPDYKLVVDMFRKQIESMYYPFESIALQKNIVYALGFFSMSFQEKQDIISYCRLYLEEYELIIDKLKDLPEIPTLLELGRNKSREFIQSRCSFTKPYQLSELVEKLNLPVQLKNIITFKTPLYL
ncbi:hypothetical protein FQR65_LT14497 [Abscondita terminalis]|nr:hypothetical protein FQR65_LT14497 [Abscondita terminalis]